MSNPLFRYYVAVSLDGYIATADGGVAWLDPFNGEDFGYEAFLSAIGTVVLGRATYDQVLGFGAWPYRGKQGYVVTSKTLSDPPDGVQAHHGGIGDLARRLRAEADEDIWIVGGGRTAAGFLAAGALDRIELFVMPVLLGTGIPFLPAGANAANLSLIASEPAPRGVVKLTYSVESAGQS
ncbi:MAG: dihydrofolate reductase family protein [Alphaproteobacteria bacterium]|nr:dihydrofolate reductase family protein [Alphaproteobacteria bacterium]